MRQIFEEGDRVQVTSTGSYGINYRNKQTGTESFPEGTTLTCTIVRTWYDYETGRRYVGRTDEGQEIYFGEFRVQLEGV
jgi:hypothetical protein